MCLKYFIYIYIYIYIYIAIKINEVNKQLISSWVHFHGIFGFNTVGLPALFFSVLGVVVAIEEPTSEKLHGDDSEDELEEHVDDHDVEDILQRIDNAVKHRLQCKPLKMY